MKILFVSTKGPLPLNDGHSLRTYHLLKQAAEHHEIYLASFVKFPEEYDHIRELKAFCRQVIFIDLPANRSAVPLGLLLVKNIFSAKPLTAQKYSTYKMRTAIRQVLHKNRIDLIHLDMLPLCCYLDGFKNVPVVLNEHNVESALLKRLADCEVNPFKKFYYGIQQKRLERFEYSAVRRCRHVICCSSQDQKLLAAMAPQTPASVLPNGVDTQFFKYNKNRQEDDIRLVFVGGLNWPPNRDAVKWFDRDILPLILKKHPGVSLDVIGRGDRSINWQHPDRIIQHGHVEDVRPCMEKASVFIVPLRIGGGTRLKILNAMSMGKAIVSTAIGVEGLEVENQRHYFRADSVEEFSAAVTHLVSDYKLRKKIGIHARQQIEQRYRWEIIGRQLRKVYALATA